jgi:hypothetical protein
MLYVDQRALKLFYKVAFEEEEPALSDVEYLSRFSI